MTIKNIVTSVDVAPVPYSVTFNQKTHYQLFVCGILSIVLWIVIFLLSIDKLISIFEKKEMYLNSMNERTWEEIQLKDMNLNLVVQISDSNTIITKDNQFEYGLNLTYSTYEKQKQNEYDVSNYPLDSESYNFFLPSSFVANVEGDIYQQERYFEVQVRFCDQGVDPSCKKINKNSHLNLKLTWDRPLLNLQREGEVIQMSQIEDFKTVNMSQLQKNTRREIFYMQGMNLDLDQSVFPTVNIFSSSEKITSWYYDLDKSTEQLNILQSQVILQSYSFRRSKLTTKYERSYKKIDTGIAQTLGIFSLASLILYLFSEHYKNWAKNILITATLSKNKTEDPSFKNYVKYVRNKDGEKEEMDEKFERVLQKLDLIRLREQVDEMKEKVNEICERVKIPGLKKGEAVELIEAESKPGEKSLKESLLKEK